MCAKSVVDTPETVLQLDFREFVARHENCEYVHSVAVVATLNHIPIFASGMNVTIYWLIHYPSSNIMHQGSIAESAVIERFIENCGSRIIADRNSILLEYYFS